MKTTRYIAAALLILMPLTFTGCDAFRKLAGRPTSGEIAVMKATLEENARQDSIARQKEALDRARAIADSVEFSDSALASRGIRLASRTLAQGVSDTLSHRYYVIIGAFGQPEHARKLASSVESSGYAATLIPYQSGIIIVGLCPADDRKTACDNLAMVEKEPFCPASAWILDRQ